MVLLVQDPVEPQRTNRLGIVDLTIPDGTPPEWAERVFQTGLVRFAEIATLGTARSASAAAPRNGGMEARDSTRAYFACTSNRRSWANPTLNSLL